MCSYICSPWCTQVVLSSSSLSGTTKVTKLSPGGMQGSNSFNWNHCLFLILLELPSCMIWSKLSWSKYLVVHLIFTLSFCAHTYGKLSSYQASFVISWSTLVIAQLVSSLILYNWIIIHGTNSIGYSFFLLRYIVLQGLFRWFDSKGGEVWVKARQVWIKSKWLWQKGEKRSKWSKQMITTKWMK